MLPGHALTQPAPGARAPGSWGCPEAGDAESDGFRCGPKRWVRLSAVPRRSCCGVVEM